MNTLTISGVLKDAWRQFIENISYVYYLLAPMFVFSLLGILLYPEFFYVDGAGNVDVARTLPSVIITFAGLILGFFATISLLFFFRSGKKDSWQTWLNYFRLLPKYIIVSLLQGLMILIGLILFVIPGLYLAARYAFVGYRTLENPTLSIGNLFRAEAESTKGNRVTILIIGAILVIIAFLFGALFNMLFPNFMSPEGNPMADFLFELLVTPFFSVVSILTYLKLTGREAQEVTPEAPLVKEEAETPTTVEPIV